MSAEQLICGQAQHLPLSYVQHSIHSSHALLPVHTPSTMLLMHLLMQDHDVGGTLWVGPREGVQGSFFYVVQGLCKHSNSTLA